VIENATGAPLQLGPLTGGTTGSTLLQRRNSVQGVQRLHRSIQLDIAVFQRLLVNIYEIFLFSTANAHGLCGYIHVFF
jgi:hypothetical protein